MLVILKTCSRLVGVTSPTLQDRGLTLPVRRRRQPLCYSRCACRSRGWGGPSLRFDQAVTAGNEFKSWVLLTLVKINLSWS